ncbi:hypothetical protein BpHYR1_030664 [Brachionus plicatilis]|uniref:Uncharacterized protein n=1 Tax=Brachionus plicatilis TaxID=10195 RepID=A0A3M7QDT4_BRAPC|nr:hypothetical protein BpHYR1_030664 [Brachionus plicatilis]
MESRLNGIWSVRRSIVHLLLEQFLFSEQLLYINGKKKIDFGVSELRLIDILDLKKSSKGSTLFEYHNYSKS